MCVINVTDAINAIREVTQLFFVRRGTATVSIVSRIDFLSSNPSTNHFAPKIMKFSKECQLGRYCRQFALEQVRI